MGGQNVLGKGMFMGGMFKKLKKFTTAEASRILKKK